MQVVGYADDAEGAIAQLLRDPPPCDLVIIDVLLRRGSGVDVLKALQASVRRPRCVVPTNFATTLISDHCLALGGDRVFDKSAEVERLLEHCETLGAGTRLGAAHSRACPPRRPRPTGHGGHDRPRHRRRPGKVAPRPWAPAPAGTSRSQDGGTP